MEGLETVIHESAFVDLKRHQTKQSRKVTQGRATEQSVTAWITELHYQKIPPQLLIFLPLRFIQTFLLVHMLGIKTCHSVKF